MSVYNGNTLELSTRSYIEFRGLIAQMVLMAIRARNRESTIEKSQLNVK